MIEVNGWLSVAAVAIVFLAGAAWGYLNACLDNQERNQRSDR